ncbi:MAG: hypothetical protein ACRDQT_06165 [Gaiellaceae bacterium]
MHSRTLAVVSLALGTVVLAGAGAALSSQGSPAAPVVVHRHAAATQKVPAGLAPMLAESRLATAKYATNLARAKKDGYTVTVTRHIPDMGWHFLNPKYTKFDVTKPAILVYVKRGSRWQLVAFEWVFPEKPAKRPLPGAKYGSFGAACHYQDGTFVFAETEDACAEKSPESGAAFGFWHPDLVTLHTWVWYPNPDGIFAGANPLLKPFNRG